MERVIRAFPILPGKEDEARDAAREMAGERADGMADFYRRFGVVSESWHEQQTPAGTWFIVVTDIGDKPAEAAGREYAASQHEFDAWFRGRVKEITGVDPQTAPLGPPTTCVFSWPR